MNIDSKSIDYEGKILIEVEEINHKMRMKTMKLKIKCQWSYWFEPKEAKC